MATWIQVICSIPIVYSFLVARWIARWQEELKAMAMHLDTGIGSIPIVQPYFLDVTCLKSRTFAVFLLYLVYWNSKNSYSLISLLTMKILL